MHKPSKVDPDIREYLSYDPETGIFLWRKILPPTRRTAIGDRAGSIHPSGYRHIKFRGRRYRGSRLAWFFTHGEMPPPEIYMDHKNRIRDDDRIRNLRLATPAESTYNRTSHKCTSSKYKGVTFNNKSSCWQAGLKFKGKSNHLGLFDTEEAAAHAYDAAALMLHGEFARLNFEQGA